LTLCALCALAVLQTRAVGLAEADVLFAAKKWASAANAYEKIANSGASLQDRLNALLRAAKSREKNACGDSPQAFS